MVIIRMGAFVSLLALPACLGEEEVESSTAAVVHGNGKSLNGKSLNGKSLNGKSLNGSSLGTELAWVEHEGARTSSGVPFDETWLEGSELVARRGPAQFRGTQLRGTELQARSDTGAAVALRIEDVLVPAAGSDVWRYRVQFRTDAGWLFLCESETGPHSAVPLSDHWDLREGVPGGGDKLGDPTRFTFACSDIGALGKCVDIGYRPWAVVGSTALDEHHQSCVRLLRNDACGDGTPHTSDGSLVNLYDGIGIQQDTEDWLIEAEWDAAGARCLGPSSRSLEVLPCADDLVRQDCGDPASFGLGTHLISEGPPPG